MPRPILTVPQPCHESWAAMTPAAQGRHCAACSKVVVDFTRMSDAELLAYLSQAKGTTCGRFTGHQLNRPLRAPAMATRWWQIGAALAVLSVGVAAAPVAAQTKNAPVEQRITMGMLPITADLLVPQTIISGWVTDAAGTHLPGVTVLVQGTTTGVSTGPDGSFALSLPATNQPIVLLFSSIGFEPRQVTVQPSSGTSAVTVELTMDYTVMGLMYAPHWYTPRGLWQRLTQLLQR
ncbi:carboxypeptidase-like regulatory domain-containing protein [Hymenobacter glacieicola]|uniref:Carboxypeptidase-like regulatory domain-containing protein n=1 Tax=Hymenobacter glacieicola TaxID=1562124 RepID=A0ABQ1WSY4_9BACT|nr:carboxypeptidase-like regulatory domain-containing protein [Hymenobacter glacieicola]GGG44088.1 hypothetical protein GCM10011378_20490 [Hymenobacter glacieicola]